MPDMLDLLTISLSAGLGFQGGLQEVARRATGPMAQELNTVLRDVRLGHSRREALRAFASRVNVDEITNFVAAILQAEELGSPLREALRAQATQLRAARRLRAEERARKSTVVMLLPMMMFIFPALFVVLVGPAVPSFIPMFTRQAR
jgi:tight adherence protein C